MMSTHSFENLLRISESKSVVLGLCGRQPGLATLRTIIGCLQSTMETLTITRVTSEVARMKNLPRISMILNQLHPIRKT